MAKFPKAYVDEVPAVGTAAGIEYPPFHHMDIGARRSGLPARGSNGPHGLEHVGKDVSGGGNK